MAPIVDQQHHSHHTHHHSATKASHKPFKPRHTSKNVLRDRSKGKVELTDRQNSRRKSRHQQVLSKLDRRNLAKQKRLASRHAYLDAASIFAGKDGAPRIVAIVSLSDDEDVAQVVKSLGAGANVDADVEAVKSSLHVEGQVRIEFERFKQRLQFVSAGNDMLSTLDACRLADFVLFVLAPDDVILSEGAQDLLKIVESQGISNVLVAVQGLERIEAKRRPQILTTAKISLSRFFPDLGKVHSLDVWQDCLNVVRSLCSTTPKGINWRDDRSWMLVEDVRWPYHAEDTSDDTVTGEAIITGVVRGKRLGANRLVQLGDLGDYQIEKIVAAPLASKRKARIESMTIDDTNAEAILDQSTEDQDDLLELAPEEVCMDDADVDDAIVSMATSQRNGVLLDDHRYFSDEDGPVMEPKRLPKGTSKYQAAWFLGDEDDSGSDVEDVEPTPDINHGGLNGYQRSEVLYDDDNIIDEPLTEAVPSEHPDQSEMFLDPSPEDEAEAEAIKAHRAQHKGNTEAEEDGEFPDEVELPPNVLARERLARYRGLKNPRTSEWDTGEDRPYEPAEWRRLLEIRDYKSARNKVLKETLTSSDGVVPGSRVNIHLRNISLSLLRKNYDKTKPLGLFQLLRHEHKQTAINYSITLQSSVQDPIKSKSEVIVQCGPRRLVVNPIFSVAGSTPNNVHKLIRYLQPSQSAVASFIGPLTWGAVPVLYFQREDSQTSTNPTLDNPLSNPQSETQAKPIAQTQSSSNLHLIGTGTALPPSTTRITAKRIIITGHPYKIHKRLVTVRYMFFNAEDVNWFRALRLWTRRGRSGYIKESLGTHGYFKATFDGKVGMMDAVGVTIWKRVWPRMARRWVPKLGEKDNTGMDMEITTVDSNIATTDNGDVTAAPSDANGEEVQKMDMDF